MVKNIHAAARRETQPSNGVTMYVPNTRKSTIETASLMIDSPKTR